LIAASDKHVHLRRTIWPIMSDCKDMIGKRKTAPIAGSRIAGRRIQGPNSKAVIAAGPDNTS
jgi:hypothetical protein